MSTTDERVILSYIGHSKVDTMPTHGGGASIYNVFYLPNKYDTLGGWHLVSDTSKSWNPVSAMYLYDVRVYTGLIDGMDNKTETSWINPKHFKWLDSNYKPFYLKVW